MVRTRLLLKIWLHSAVRRERGKLLLATAVVSTLSLAGLVYGVGADHEESDRINVVDVKATVAKQPSPISSKASVPSDSAATLTGSLQSGSEAVQGALVNLSPQGFQPNVITRHGKFFLIVNNQTSLKEIVLSLDRENGGTLRTTQITRGKRFSAGELSLSPGRYVLTEANHPNWVCRITVTAN